MSVTSTYRFQLHQDFTFDDAREQLSYVRDLGISHVYCSPILTAVPGSMHGYDVLDHTKVNSELGGREAFTAFAQHAHELGLGVIVDVVPNHISFVAPENTNKPLWVLLKGGPTGPAAAWFDVDWDALEGKIGIPILGSPLNEVLEAGDITLDRSGAEPVIRYFEHVFPLAQGSVEGVSPTPDADELRELLAQQHYRLAYWRDLDATLNYRRFFEVAQLIAVRVENADVFEASHALLLELHHAGHIDGFRIDHPDGLADPEGYLAKLSNECRKGTPIWVEKILEPGEQLPKTWRCAGTTGYDAMAAITQTLLDDESASELLGQWSAQLPSDAATFDDAMREAKHFVVTHLLIPEVERLTRRAAGIRPDLDAAKLREAIIEVLLAAQVYRAYIRVGDKGGVEKMTAQSQTYLDDAFKQAVTKRSDLATHLAACRDMALMKAASDDAEANAAVRDFAIRMQQTWGPVMAKSIEDTLFYRWHPLIALNEVGGTPEVLDHPYPHALHEWAQHNAEHWPYTMTALSTHDTKRSEDVRAALLALAGDPQAWRECSQAAFALADASGLDLAATAFLWQTIAGFSTAFGPDDSGAHELGVDADRLREYLTKALREAKVYTAWIDGDETYEKLAFSLAEAVLGATQNDVEGDAAASADVIKTLAVALRNAILAARERNAEAIVLTGHTQKVLELFAPGVPDTYQGSERPTLSLVDPDNRRRVDYAELRELLQTPGTRPYLIKTLLAEHAPAHAGAPYLPLESNSDVVVAFMRGQRNSGTARALAATGRQVRRFGREKENPAQAVVVIGVRAASRALRDGLVDRAEVKLPAGRYRHVLSGQIIETDGEPLALTALTPHEYGHLHVLAMEN